MRSEFIRMLGTAFLTVAAALPSPVLAEKPQVMPIIQAGPLVYADVEGHLYIVVVRGAMDAGIFVAYSSSKVPIQQFSPDQLPPDTAVLYLSYDTVRNIFRQLVISETQIYSILGGFRVRLGKDVVMGVDTFNTSYVSFVVERPGEKPTILAFVGLEKVILAQDEKAAALLAATQSLEEYRSFIDEYQLTTNGLLLGNNPVKIGQVGIQLTSQNPCLGKDSVILTKDELDAGRKLPAEEAQRQYAEKLRGHVQETLDALIMVKITDTEVTGYLPDLRRFYFIEHQRERLGGVPICLYSTAEL